MDEKAQQFPPELPENIAQPPRRGRDDALSEQGLARVRRYYDESWADYRLLWLSPASRALHFGYWDHHTRSHADSLMNMNRALAQRSDLQPGQRVLDAGCGIGGSSVWLAKTYGMQVVGIAPVASQVARARRYARQQGVEDLVRFDQQDYLDTTFPGESFDVVWALESVCHAPDKSRFLAEARRLLKPGGRLAVAEYFRTRRPCAAGDERLLQRWLDGWAIPNLATGSEFTAWAAKTGFTDVRLEDITPSVRPSLRRLYRITLLCYPAALFLHALGFRSDVQHGNTRGARDQYQALQRGLWFYGLLVAKSVVSQDQRLGEPLLQGAG